MSATSAGLPHAGIHVHYLTLTMLLAFKTCCHGGATDRECLSAGTPKQPC